MRRLLLATALVTLAYAAPAVAALEFRPCTGTPDYECATLPVPLDPSTPGGETISLEVRRLHETREGRGVLVALAGGPGQGASDFIDDFAEILADGLVDRQLIVFDQRGTGRSGALTCPALAHGVARLRFEVLADRVGRCADELGPRRRFYTSAEVVTDLEALRAALGAQQLSLFGVSYGAFVAQRYARAYPARVDRLVLDSPVAQDQGGAFDASSYVAARRVLRALCHCEAGVRRLAARLPVQGTAYDARGRPRVVRLESPGELFDLLVASDFSPALRAALPAAILSAVRGDTAALARLVAIDRESAADEDPEAFSNALFFTTTCLEKPQPWGSAAALLTDRSHRRLDALDALGDLPPFGAGAADSTQVGTGFCLVYTPTEVAATPAPGPIEANALVLSGSEDLRTPTEEARRTVAELHNGTLVRVPGAGHAVVSQNIACVRRAVSRFFGAVAVGNPCDARTAGRPRPAARGVSRAGLRGRGVAVAAGVLATVADAIRMAAVAGPLSEPFRGGGLRGGRFCAHPGEIGADGRRPLLLTLRSDRFVRALAVTGSAVVTRSRLSALSVRVRGHGRLVLDGHVLRARGVRARVAASRLRMPGLTVPAAVDATAC